MNKNELVIIADYSDEMPLTLDEVCQICHSTPEFIEDLITYEILFPQGDATRQWLFNSNHIKRTKTVIRLQRDLEMNVPSIAIVLDLLEQIESLQARMAIIERHVLK